MSDPGAVEPIAGAHAVSMSSRALAKASCLISASGRLGMSRHAATGEVARGAPFAEAPRQLLNECQGVGRKNLVATLIDAANDLDVGYKVVHDRPRLPEAQAAIASADLPSERGGMGRECPER